MRGCSGKRGTSAFPLNKSNRRTSGGGNTAAAIERVDIADLQPWGKNARVHSPKQVRQLARAIEELGFINPVLIDADNRILAGHGRVAAAKISGCVASRACGSRT